MATPLFGQVKRLFPQAWVTAITHEPIAQLLDGIDDIDEFLVFSRAQGKKRQEEQRIAKELKKRHIDLGILLTGSLSSAWMFWKGHVTWRVGLTGHWRRLLLNIPVKPPTKEQHDLLTYGELLRPFGGTDREPVLQLKVRESEREEMRRLLEIAGKRPTDKLLVINPGAAYGSAKCWPPANFRAVAQSLSTQENIFCLFVGDKSSVAMIDEIIAGLPKNVKSIAGATSLRQLMAVLSLGDCVLSNDSGPMHIAAALKRPLIALFGSTNPQRTRPWGCGTVLYKHVSCSPCYLRECPRDFRCMRSIDPEEVIRYVLKNLWREKDQPF